MGDGEVFINFTGVCTCGSLVGDGSNLDFPGFLSKKSAFQVRSIVMAQDSKIKVNSIVHKTDGQAVTVSFGATIPSTGSLTVSGNCNFSGVVTAHHLQDRGKI